MKVPLLDLKAQYATVREQVLHAVAEVLESQVCILGPKVTELEKKIAKMSGCKYAVGVSSGTDALLCSLMSLGIGPRDEVITTPFTFFATAGCIARAGATPVFVDIDRRTYNINPDLILKAISSRTKAIMPVHLFGQMCDMDPIMDLAREHGLHVIEDAAQAITATYKGIPAGSIGTVGCFSFFPSKNLGCAGDGGMIVTNDEEFYQRAVIMRTHGAKPKYFHKYIGGNFRLDPLQAAILLAKLPHLENWTKHRRHNAAYYDAKLTGTNIQSPYIRPDCSSIYNQYVIRTPDRDRLQTYLRDSEIGSEIYYPRPLHLQECFKGCAVPVSGFPESEAASREVLATPNYPELTTEQLEFVSERMLQFASGQLECSGQSKSVHEQSDP
jgi:dTDP-4-amino-4,6-dideoxygalactose transaminase